MIEFTKKEMKYCKNFDIHYKDVLTTTELGVITKEMLRFYDYTEREYVRNILMTKFLTDIPEEYDYTSNYDMMCENGLFEFLYEVAFASMTRIEEAIKYEESLPKQLRILIDKVPKDLDTNKITDMIKKYGNKK